MAAIHVAALSLLESQGMKVLSPIARKRYAQAGASVDEATQVVCIDRGLVAKALATTPSEFTFQALDPEFNVKVGGRHVCLAPTSGPPNIMDIHNGRRAGTFEDFCNLMKLSPELRRHSHAGWRGRTAGRPVQPASLRDDAVDAAAVGQDAVHFLRAARSRSRTASRLIRIAHRSAPTSSSSARTCGP